MAEMKRTKGTVKTWVKTKGGGEMYLADGQVITELNKPFEAKKEDIPQGAFDLVEEVETKKKKKKKKSTKKSSSSSSNDNDNENNDNETDDNEE